MLTNGDRNVRPDARLKEAAVGHQAAGRVEYFHRVDDFDAGRHGRVQVDGLDHCPDSAGTESVFPVHRTSDQGGSCTANNGLTFAQLKGYRWAILGSNQ
jgi:hypothetical protein